MPNPVKDAIANAAFDRFKDNIPLEGVASYTVVQGIIGHVLQLSVRTGDATPPRYFTIRVTENI